MKDSLLEARGGVLMPRAPIVAEDNSHRHTSREVGKAEGWPEARLPMSEIPRSLGKETVNLAYSFWEFGEKERDGKQGHGNFTVFVFILFFIVVKHTYHKIYHFKCTVQYH